MGLIPRREAKGAVEKMTEASARVMVVEDAPEYQSAVVLALLLEPEFKDVHLASSGEEALEDFESVSPELVLLDYRLPGIDGLETAKRMTEQRPEVKVVLVTAHSEEIFARAAKDAGVQEIIPKSQLSVTRLQKLLD